MMKKMSSEMTRGMPGSGQFVFSKKGDKALRTHVHAVHVKDRSAVEKSQGAGQIVCCSGKMLNLKKKKKNYPHTQTG